ncbi:MAG: phosphotransferase [Phycisphaerales bacterium]|nr:phosphotransferase [Phycisphaerales bacterium]
MDEPSAESIAPPMAHQPPPGPRSPAIHADLNHDEIRTVLARYELGAVHRVSDLRAGSALSPKAIVECERGKLLLKRRARGLDIPTVVAFAHEVMLGCSRGGLCVPPLVGTKAENNSMVQVRDFVYELFVFIEGSPYARTTAHAFQSGALLGETHRVMDTVRTHSEPSVEPVVVDPARGAGWVPTDRFDQSAIEHATRLLQYGEDLVRANASPNALVHGDWHPGNMIYQGDHIVAVCDFDSTRIGSRIRELAQGLLYFSLRSDNTAEPDRALLEAFWDGYRSDSPMSVDPRVLASLMPAVLVDEGFASAATTPNANHGPMLAGVLARARWLDDHHDKLTSIFASR